METKQKTKIAAQASATAAQHKHLDDVFYHLSESSRSWLSCRSAAIALVLGFSILGCQTDTGRPESKPPDSPSQSNPSTYSAAPATGNSENVVIRKVRVVKDAQPFIVSFRSLLSGPTDKWEPIVENRTPQSPWVYLILDCNVQFPGKTRSFDLKENFVLIDASGNRHTAYQLLSSAWISGEGFTRDHGWSVEKGRKNQAQLQIMFTMEENKLNQLKLLFSSKEYNVELPN
jgi:hypothetical protein